ncbi:MAG: hypothetical protein KGL44_02695 [Sphingomonadales bacterium]|nr:hypothetical protein [Sphingomonadales bacterium]
MSGLALAEAAEALAGCRFRLYGRDPATGVDCIGLLAAALMAIDRPAPLPLRYTLRSRNDERFTALAGPCGFEPASGAALPGDVLIFAVGPHQYHLGIAARTGDLVHAHAGLRRVVIAPAPAGWPITGHWRLRPAT